jgi:hypothetical protein
MMNIKILQMNSTELQVKLNELNRNYNALTLQCKELKSKSYEIVVEHNTKLEEAIKQLEALRILENQALSAIINSYESRGQAALDSSSHAVSPSANHSSNHVANPSLSPPEEDKREDNVLSSIVE